jgi:hypothetical protein
MGVNIKTITERRVGGAACEASGACTLAIGVAACLPAGFKAKASRTAAMVQLYAILR